jgi:hypothetical protein
MAFRLEWSQCPQLEVPNHSSILYFVKGLIKILRLTELKMILKGSVQRKLWWVKRSTTR